MNERMNGSVTFCHWKTPNRRRTYSAGSLSWKFGRHGPAHCWIAYQKRQVTVRFTDERIREMEFSVDNEFLKINLDAGLFQPIWSGTIEYKFKTAVAQTLVTRIQARIEQTKGRVVETE
jgi:hypothetical protein